MAGDEKTEAATPRKRGEMRRRGRVARSADLSSMCVFIGLIVCLHAVGGQTIAGLQTYLQSSLGGLHEASLSTPTLFTRSVQAMVVIGRAVGPIALTGLLMGLIVSFAQTGFLFSTQALAPDFTHMNPLVGVQRIASGRGVVETVKALAKILIIGYIAYGTISGNYPLLLETIRRDIPSALSVIGDLVYRLALRLAMCLAVLAALDYAYQHWSYERSIRMTKEEVKQESKQQEGDPLIRSRIRARQRQAARRRMMAEVPTADVVITNPTHFAVALRYEAASMAAPRVVAKGADLLALRIRDLAREHTVPVVENPPLARSLYRSVEVGGEVPSELYAAVAEVLAYVYQVDSRRLAATPA